MLSPYLGEGDGRSKLGCGKSGFYCIYFVSKNKLVIASNQPTHSPAIFSKAKDYTLSWIVNEEEGTPSVGPGSSGSGSSTPNFIHEHRQPYNEEQFIGTHIYSASYILFTSCLSPVYILFISCSYSVYIMFTSFLNPVCILFYPVYIMFTSCLNPVCILFYPVYILFKSCFILFISCSYSVYIMFTSCLYPVLSCLYPVYILFKSCFILFISCSNPV